MYQYMYLPAVHEIWGNLNGNSYLFYEFGDIIKRSSDRYHWGERSKMCSVYGGIRIKYFSDRGKTPLSSIKSRKFDFRFPTN